MHIHSLRNEMGFPGGSDGKESAVNPRDLGSIPGLARSPGERGSSILAWEIPWTEEPGEQQSMGCKGLNMIEQLTLSFRNNTG